MARYMARVSVSERQLYSNPRDQYELASMELVGRLMDLICERRTALPATVTLKMQPTPDGANFTAVALVQEEE